MCTPHVIPAKTQSRTTSSATREETARAGRGSRRSTDIAPMAVPSLAPVLTPHGRLSLIPSDDGTRLDPALAHRLIAAFDRGPGHGLLRLGAGEVGTALPAVLGYWREFGARFVTAVCGLPDLDHARGKARLPAPSPAELQELALAAPPMMGAEYLTRSEERRVGKECRL